MSTIDEKIKSAKQKLGEKIPCSIEVLTPVHIGSGVKLAKGIDFIKTEYSVHIVPQAELMKYLEDNPDEMNRFINGGYNLNALSKIPDGRKYNIYIGNTREINEFERNGNGQVYIPGSSVKGSIRTAIFTAIFNSWSNDKKEKLLNDAKNYNKGESWASEPLLVEAFGKDSNYNLMRILQIFDIQVLNDVFLEKLVLLSLKSENEYGWKRMGKDKKTGKPHPLQDDPKKATNIFVEALPIGTIGYFTISIDNFLVNDPIAKSELNYSENALQIIRNLATILKNYSKEKLKKEKEFFEKLKNPKPLTSVVKEIDNLLDKIKNLSSDEFIIRLSWGSGWKGMTGDFLDENWLNIFRQKYRLGKQNFPFPKTRRIVFEDDEPKYLTGWIKVKLNERKPAISASDNNSDIETDPIELLRQKFKVTESKKNK